LNKEDYQSKIPFIQYQSHEHNSDEVYPQYQHLGDLLKQWSPYDTSTKGWNNSLFHPNKHKEIRRFNFSDHQERELALNYRVREVPFVMYDIDLLDKAASGPFSLSALFKTFGNSLKRAERSRDNYFLYYSMKKSPKNFLDWKPPQEDILLSFRDFIEEASTMENKDDNSVQPHLYMTISAGEV
jgi:hypothetical protein